MERAIIENEIKKYNPLRIYFYNSKIIEWIDGDKPILSTDKVKELSDDEIEELYINLKIGFLEKQFKIAQLCGETEPKDDRSQFLYMIPNKIETYKDLPEYGKFVLVNGIDKNMYGTRRWHVCEMNDLEDGLDFKDNGEFYWLTEKGTKIEDVTHWCELPPLEN